MDFNTFLKKLFRQSLEALSPTKTVQEKVTVEEGQIQIAARSFELDDDTSVYLLSVGKAAVDMFEGLHKVLGDRISGSLVITPDEEQALSCSADIVLIGSHPEPDEDSINAGKRAVQFCKETPANAVVFMLISGGTSSLMCLPGEGISAADLHGLYRLLNNSGADIYEINTVRKHCSQIKGGQLLRYLNPDIMLIDLIISDVPGDDLSIIGSGPVTPDSSTFEDARSVLEKYELWDTVPDTIRSHISKGIEGEIPETVKPGEDPVSDHHSHIIASAGMLAEKISELAADEEIDTWVADEAYSDDVNVLAPVIADKAIEVAEGRSGLTRPALLIWYGEGTVQVTGEGKGGRNQELALRGAMEISGHENITWLSAGTDGIDGPTDAAGAVVDGGTIKKAREKGLNPEEYLKNNDSFHFHKQMNTLLKTGPTGNNLMDLTLVLIE